MLIRPLEERDISSVALITDPLDDAIVLGNLFGCRELCDFLGAERDGEIIGVAETFHAFPFPNFNFHCKDADSLPPLIDGLIARNARLQGEVYAMLPESKLQVLRKNFTFLHEEPEYQMILSDKCEAQPCALQVARLSSQHIPLATRLAEEAGLSAWYEGVFDRGPVYGTFSDSGELVAMAGTHCVTRYISEIGHVATHSDYRRKGLASACMRELAKELSAVTDKIMLMVAPGNEGAVKAYEKLGFRHHQTLQLISIRP